jgi:hypothetical protein
MTSLSQPMSMFEEILVIRVLMAGLFYVAAILLAWPLSSWRVVLIGLCILTIGFMMKEKPR